MKKKSLFSLVAIAAVMFMFFACDNNGPSSPTVTPDPNGAAALNSIGEGMSSLSSSRRSTTGDTLTNDQLACGYRDNDPHRIWGSANYLMGSINYDLNLPYWGPGWRLKVWFRGKGGPGQNEAFRQLSLPTDGPVSGSIDYLYEAGDAGTTFTVPIYVERVNPDDVDAPFGQCDMSREITPTLPPPDKVCEQGGEITGHVGRRGVFFEICPNCDFVGSYQIVRKRRGGDDNSSDDNNGHVVAGDELGIGAGSCGEVGYQFRRPRLERPKTYCLVLKNILGNVIAEKCISLEIN